MVWASMHKLPWVLWLNFTKLLRSLNFDTAKKINLDFMEACMIFLNAGPDVLLFLVISLFTVKSLHVFKNLIRECETSFKT